MDAHRHLLVFLGSSLPQSAVLEVHTKITFGASVARLRRFRPCLEGRVRRNVDVPVEVKKVRNGGRRHEQLFVRIQELDHVPCQAVLLHA